MSRNVIGIGVASFCVALLMGVPQVFGADEKAPAKVDSSCAKCHPDYEKGTDLFAGRIADVSIKAKVIQLNVNKDVELIHYDDSTVLKNAPTFKELPKQEAVKITYARKDGKNVALEVEVKKGIEVPAEKLASVEEVSKLVAEAPEKGKYILLDSRPANLFNEGHIPNAVSMPFSDFDKLAETLLKDKDLRQIYYCAGLSCVLSPLAAKKAEKQGFTNIKVFRAGLPAWQKAGFETVSNISGIDNYDKNGMSYVLIDLRPAKEIEQGHLPKAIAIDEKSLGAMKDSFPKFMGAPIILYNQDGNIESARAAYKAIGDWGYKHVTILEGGYQGWVAAGKQVDKGPAGTSITYVRKLGPGEFEIDKFRELVKAPSTEFVVLDVRNKTEAEEGAFPNTLNIPLDELENRTSELPKDKKIVLHCGTGARAEMAYNVLKKAGIEAKFVKAKIDFDKDNKGKYTIEE